MERVSITKQVVAIILTIALVFNAESGYFFLTGENIVENVEAASTQITSISYFNNGADGPVQSKKGVDNASYGFVMPKFNGMTSQQLDLPAVEEDLQLYVKQEIGTNGQWKKIEDVPYFIFNATWGWQHEIWSPTADGWICWFKLEETTQIRFHGITNNVNLEYTLNFTKLDKVPLTAISITNNGEKNQVADSTGGFATHWNYFLFNNDANVTYDQIKDDMDVLVDNKDGKGFVPLLSNADSGFIWDQNFGIYTDGYGGYWFTGINWSCTFRFQKKGNPSIYTDMNVTYNEPVRNNWTLSSFDGKTTLDSKENGDEGSVAIPLPKIGGQEPVKSDLDLFVYEVCVGATYNNGTWTGGKWVLMSDIIESGWNYQASGYNKYFATQQWGYWVDHVYGLWFRPVLKDTYFRVGYPRNGKAGGDIDNNYVYYTFLGNPNVAMPDDSDMTDIEVDDDGDSIIEVPEGWKMIFNDEFEGNALDATKWTMQTGSLLDENDIGTFGWGNNELQHYTDSDKNIMVNNGSLNIRMLKEPKEFYEKDDPTKHRTALYSSGKIISQHKFSMKYGRVDFRAKFPTGNGMWPALWMMPNDDRYGSWASSGEIDIFEGRGRASDVASAALHYGGPWPGDTYSSNTFNMVNDGNKKTDFTDWHIYSIVWNEDSIKIYADGTPYYKCTNEEWFSTAYRNNKNAPFDQRFYLIMNLAAGGVFDGGIAPDFDTFTQKDMYVDYVRVFQMEVDKEADEKADTNQGVSTNGADDDLYGDYKFGTGVTNPEIPTTGNDEETTSRVEVETTSKADIEETTKPDNKPIAKVKVSKIKIKGISHKIAAGKKIKLRVMVWPKNTTYKKVKWKSSNRKYATVNSKGWVRVRKAAKGKKVVITATARDGSKVKARYKIYIMPKAVRKITLKATKKVVKAGRKVKIKATVLPHKKVNKKLKWKSSNRKYATVNSKGVVKTKKAGKGKIVVITARATDGSKKRKKIRIRIK